MCIRDFFQKFSLEHWFSFRLKQILLRKSEKAWSHQPNDNVNREHIKWPYLLFLSRDMGEI